MVIQNIEMGKEVDYRVITSGCHVAFYEVDPLRALV